MRRVDHVRSRLYSSALALTALLATGCAAAGSGAIGSSGVGMPDPQEAQRLQAATAPVRPAQVTFDWNMTDRDARFSGQGVLRIDSGYRARVDLFGPRGETLAAAVVIDGVMRVVPDAAEEMLPPAAMLWASLGVFRAPADAALTGTTTGEGGTSLEYSRDGIRWSFRFEGDRLVHTEWTDGAGRRTVELTGSDGAAFPGQAVFRDWTEFRELTLRVTDVEERAAFEPDVWILPGEY